MTIEAIEILDSGEGQSIQLPSNFKINDTKVYLKKTGNVVHIIPFHEPWESLLKSLEEFTSDYMSERDQPIGQNRPAFD